MNLVRALKRMRNVAEVRDFSHSSSESITLVYFLCPCISTKKISLNSEGTGFTVSYVNRLSITAKERIAKAREFQASVTVLGWECNPLAIWASADAYFLYQPFPGFPLPPADAPANLIPNGGAFLDHECDFKEICRDMPWRRASRWVVDTERKRLLSMLPEDASRSMREDFVRKVFAGMALDGTVLRKGVFGKNSVILGVESPGVAFLQNCALEPTDRIPVIQLK